MKDSIYFDLQKSRDRLRLVYRSGVVEILETISFVLVMLLLNAGFLLITLGVSPNNVNYGFLVYFILPLVTVFCVYAIIRKFLERRLVRIETRLPESKIRQVLLSFLIHEHYEYRDGGSVIFAVEQELLSYALLWTKNLVFILGDGELLFNVRKQYPMINPPVFVSHILLKRKLERRFAASEV